MTVGGRAGGLVRHTVQALALPSGGHHEAVHPSALGHHSTASRQWARRGSGGRRACPASPAVHSPALSEARPGRHVRGRDRRAARGTEVAGRRVGAVLDRAPSWARCSARSAATVGGGVTSGRVVGGLMESDGVVLSLAEVGVGRRGWTGCCPSVDRVGSVVVVGGFGGGGGVEAWRLRGSRRRHRMIPVARRIRVDWGRGVQL